MLEWTLKSLISANIDCRSALNIWSSDDFWCSSYNKDIEILEKNLDILFSEHDEFLK